MKPAVCLVFTMKKGRLEVYLNVEQFSKLRYKVANAIKSVYSIEMKTLFWGLESLEICLPFYIVYFLF